ncbi:MAG: D-alanyl-D-alanine carboxypeptidase family protein [Solirubrobacteraceae bacterium]
MIRLLLALLAVGLIALAAGASAHAARDGPPSLQAGAAVLVQPDTEDVVLRRSANERRSIASTTKLMTALVTLEHADLDDRVRAIGYAASPVESLMGLQRGDRVTIRDLLRGLLLASGNDAAATLAVRVGGSRRAFVRMMNERARALGLRNTHYSNPVGLDERGNYSSAMDLVKLSLILLRNPFFARTVNRTSATVEIDGDRRRIVNRNTLLRQAKWVNGVKTGHTLQAGYVLVGSARRNGVRLVSAVLGDPSEAARDADSLALLRWGLSRYQRSTAVHKGEVLARPKLAFRDQRARLVAAYRVRTVTRRGERLDVRVVGAPREISTAVPAGRRMGTVVVSRRGRELARVPLVTAAAIPAPSLRDKVGSALPLPFVLILVAAAVLACSLLVVFGRRYHVRRRETSARRRGDTETA